MKNVFLPAVLNSDHKAFIIYIAILNISYNASDEVYSLRKVQIAHLKADKAPTKVSSKYANYANFTDIF